MNSHKPVLHAPASAKTRMAEQWANTVLTAYNDKICFVALQRYGVMKSAIMSGKKQTAANIQPIQDGSIKMIQQ